MLLYRIVARIKIEECLERTQRGAWYIVRMGSRRGVVTIRVTIMMVIPLWVLKLAQTVGEKHRGS